MVCIAIFIPLGACPGVICGSIVSRTCPVYAIVVIFRIPSTHIYTKLNIRINFLNSVVSADDKVVNSLGVESIPLLFVGVEHRIREAGDTVSEICLKLCLGNL